MIVNLYVAMVMKKYIYRDIVRNLYDLMNNKNVPRHCLYMIKVMLNF